jgi:hypothetical protein
MTVEEQKFPRLEHAKVATAHLMQEVEDVFLQRGSCRLVPAPLLAADPKPPLPKALRDVALASILATAFLEGELEAKRWYAETLDAMVAAKKRAKLIGPAA